jgi:hypothetical protein
MFERADGRGATDDERHHHVRKDDDVAEWNYRERFVDFDHISFDGEWLRLVSAAALAISFRSQRCPG